MTAQIIDLNSPLFFLPIIVLTICGLFIFYYKKILLEKREYKETEEIIRNIISTHNRYNNQLDNKISKLTRELEELFYSIYNITEQNNGVKQNIDKLTKNSISTSIINKRIINQLINIKQEIATFLDAQQKLQEQIIVLNKQKKIDEPIKFKVTNKELNPSLKLTETEQQIIQILLREGQQTAPYLEKKINKTREHTSRLMKKLWQEGFIERYTNKTPFVYFVNKKLKEKFKTARAR